MNQLYEACKRHHPVQMDKTTLAQRIENLSDKNMKRVAMLIKTYERQHQTKIPYHPNHGDRQYKVDDLPDELQHILKAFIYQS